MPVTVIPTLRPTLRNTIPLLFVAGLLVSCDTPQKKGLRELSKRGIEPSGQALLQDATP